MSKSSSQSNKFLDKPPDVSWRRWIQVIWNDFLEWPTIIALALLSLLLGTVGYIRYFALAGLSLPLLDAVYYSLQLFTMNYQALEPGIPIPFVLQIARLLAPAVAAYTLIQTLMEIFKEQSRLMRLGRFTNHVVICGLGRKGLQLVKEFRRNNQDVVVIEWDSNNSNLDTCREMGAVIYFGDARDRLVLRRAGVQRASRLISVCGDDGTNVEVAEQTRMLVEESKRSAELVCTIHIQDIHFWTLLRERELLVEHSPAFRLELFNIYDSGARLLLKDVFESIKETERPHLLIIGLGSFGENLIIRAAQEWSLRYAITRVQLYVSVIDPHVERKLESLTYRYPLIKTVCHLTPYPFQTDWPDFQDEKFLTEIVSRGDKTHAFICLDDDSMGLQAGFLLLHALQNQKIQILVRMQEDTGLAQFLREVKSTGASLSNLQAFGLLDRTCKVEMFDYSTREALARAIHEDYLEQARKAGTPVSAEISVPWDQLPEEFKESNRKQADHIGAKLKAINCGILPWREYGAEHFLFTENEIEIMAYTEHDRWVKEKEAQGWQYGPERNEALKLHPDLLKWGDERLTEEAREKDRNAARLLPMLLARAGFQIYRIQK
ncbi:MAG: hypothetical protein Fur0043_02500 [Anaerolineales bacterium]